MGCICESSKSFNKNGPPAREQILDGLKVAKAVGSKSMRCYMGSSDDRLGPLPIEAHMENTIKVFRSVRSEAMDLGVKIALENHSGDMQAREVKTIIEDCRQGFRRLLPGYRQPHLVRRRPVRRRWKPWRPTW